MKKMLGIFFPQKCELSFHFQVWKQNLRSVASQAPENSFYHKFCGLTELDTGWIPDTTLLINTTTSKRDTLFL